MKRLIVDLRVSPVKSKEPRVLRAKVRSSGVFELPEAYGMVRWMEPREVSSCRLTEAIAASRVDAESSTRGAAAGAPKGL